MENRNIHPWNAQMLYYVGDGPMVSDSTVAGVLHGRFTLTPRYVTAFANLLGIPAGDLAAATGIGPPTASDRPRHPHPQQAKLAALGWDARRLTIDQIRELRHQALEMWKADPRSWCGMCLSYHRNDEKPPTEAPSDLTWQRIGQRMVPVSASAGPRTVVDGTATGYAHSPVGALIAAAQLSARADGSAGRASWEPTLVGQFVLGDDRDVLLEALRANPDDSRVLDGFTIPAGFVFRTFTLSWADIGLVYRSPDAEGYRGAVYRLVWQNSDWMMAAPEGGSWASALRPVDDLTTAVPWGPL
jgi:hypothetical protein